MLQDRPPRGRTSWVVRGEMFDEQGAIVAIEGELDLATAPQLGAVIAEMIDYGHRHLVIDLSAAAFLDSTAMGMLLYAIAPLRDDPDAAVILAGVHGIVEKSLTVSGIGTLFTMFDTREAAISGLSDPSESLCQMWRQLRARPNLPL
jgi:anti-sigma B factor antagonist